MNERSERLDCAAVRELGPDFALGLVSGPERAAALAHLDTCAACRGFVDELAATTDALLLLAPEAEPRGGFETRVISRLGVPVARPARRVGRREVVAWLAAAACLIALALVVMVRDGGGGDDLAAGVRAATMATADGSRVGQLYLHESEPEPSWIYLSLPGWGGWQSGGWSVLVTTDDGTEHVVAVPSLPEGRQTWGAELPFDGGDVAEVAMINADGEVWCSAQLT